jgi:hypothetical protein
MEAFAGIVLLVIAMFVYAGFTAVTELDFQHFRRRDIESPRIDLTG